MPGGPTPFEALREENEDLRAQLRNMTERHECICSDWISRGRELNKLYSIIAKANIATENYTPYTPWEELQMLVNYWNEHHAS